MTPSEPATVAVVFGTRPEAIKMAPVVRALRSAPGLRPAVWVTGQHRQMLDQILDTFGITPDIDLDVMEPGQSLAGLTARAVTRLDRVLADRRPELLLVQGDTTTAFAAALTAFYHRVPVGHVEAGLRTGNLYSPWPEEANRVLITRLAALHFPPTAAARDNLLRDGVPADRVHLTGNTVIDALLYTVEQIERDPPAVPGLPPEVMAGPDRLVLITGHRRENFGPSFEAICRAIAELARQFPDVRFVYPVHLNPNVRGPVGRILGDGALANVHLLDPLPYREFLALFRRATVVLSDSGGVQEEAPSLGKPVLLMRDTTERPEAVEVGAVKLVGADFDRIVAETTRLLTDPAAYRAMTGAANPYGDGRAAERIADACTRYLQP
ncbi:MAG TPA: UDP-N-acetylglucosamine 2-epimerase (non-hydrolyzing) [Gemmataceae bacterium]|nr:UDP-N-acetylglucosamine 2-epimerase (non-hydrolyzing) [Gemmataceae bacterium]